MATRILAILALLTSLVLGASSTRAQLPTTTSSAPTASLDITDLEDPASRAQVRDLMSRLSDQEVRQLLMQRLDAVAEANGNSATARDDVDNFLQRVVTGLYEPVFTAVERLPLLLSLQMQSFARLADRFGFGGIPGLFLVILVPVGTGLAAEFGIRWLIRRWRGASVSDVRDVSANTLRGQIRFLGPRLVDEAVGLFVFYIVANIVSRAIVDPEQVPYVQLITTYLILVPRCAAVLARFLLAPHKPEFRIIHTNDATARYLFTHLIGLILLVGISIGILKMNLLNGLQMGESRLGFWLNLAAHVYLAVIVWQARDGLTMMMRGADPDITPTEERVAHAYPCFAIAVSVVMWLVVNIITSFQRFELLTGAPHYWTMALLLLAPAADTLIRGLVRTLVPPMTGAGAMAERAYQSTKHSYIRIGRAIAFSIVIISIARVWGLDFTDLAEDSVGATFAASLVEAILVLAAGYLVWELVSLWINNRLAAEQTAADAESEEASEGKGGIGGSRMSTVLPLIMVAMKGVVATLFILIALSTLGIDTTPLLAGAGVVGLAIGFGAQKLVTDIVSGVFFLIDDAFRVGEYVDVGGTMGTVEKISIRSMQLRHHLGPVHTIPHGEIAKLTNFSRDWVIMKLKFTVPFDTDPNNVKKIFKKIGAEMAQVEEFKDDFLQPFKSQGVFDFDDRGMIVRGKFMAKPGTQFTLRKEIFNRVKAAFGEAGIEFARREVQVAIPGLESATALSSEQKQAVGAAATEAAREIDTAGAAPTDTR